MDEDDQDVKAAKDAIRTALRELTGIRSEHDETALMDGIEALIEAKIGITLEQLSERIEQKLGVVV